MQHTFLGNTAMVVQVYILGRQLYPQLVGRYSHCCTDEFLLSKNITNKNDSRQNIDIHNINHSNN